MIRRSTLVSLSLSGIALAILLVGVVGHSRQAAAAFLVAYAAAVSTVLGVLAMNMIALLTSATWFGAVHHRAKRIVASLPALAVLGMLGIPAVLGLQPPVDPADAPRRIYMNPSFVVARAILYWIAWLLIAESLRASSRVHARGLATEVARRSRIVACVGLIVLAVTMTFASFDWMMSLTPRWYSTIFGVYWFGGGMTGALALLSVVPEHGLAHREKPFDAMPALGKLMLTFTMFWVYIGFAQYIVIWSANIPQEVTWHATRTHGAWGGVALALLVGAAIAFLALLPGASRRRSATITVVGALLLLLHYVDTYWMIVPGIVPVSAWLLALSASSMIIVATASLLVVRLRERTP